jgi:SAM-dependent methyltransferase
MRQDFSRIWSTLKSSGNRSDSPEYLARKASESLSILQDYCGYLSHDVTDMGCGAGELLIHLCEKVNISKAIDYSESMLAQCEQKISNSSLRLRPALLHGGIEYISELDSEFIVSTGALSQYSTYRQIQDILRLFSENGLSRHLILFDTIDPLRFTILAYISYKKNVFKTTSRSDSVASSAPARSFWGIGRVLLSFKEGIKSFYFALVAVAGFVRVLICSSSVIKLPGYLMGYGVNPSLWRSLANQHGLNCQIASSREFEYRYHVILSKQ